MAKANAKKRKALNIAMVAIIAVIIAAAVAIVGNIQGWFGGNQESPMQADNKSGYANIERAGVAYTLDDKTDLQDGDYIETLAVSSVDLNFKDVGKVAMNQRTELTVGIDGDVPTGLDVKTGDILVARDQEYVITARDHVVTTPGAVFELSVNDGRIEAFVFLGKVNIDGNEASAGERLLVLDDKKTDLGTFEANALSDYMIDTLLDLDGFDGLVLARADLKQVLDDRAEAKQKAQQAAANSEVIQIDGGSGGSGGSNGGGSSEEHVMTCTVEIRCDTILSHMDDLTPGKNAYVPSNGIILATSTVAFVEGETAFDVLQRTCKAAGIQLEYSWSPAYSSQYVEGINNLYEFDCGDLSGWVYKINGWMPNYGSSAYELKDGDVMVWAYTCEGLGADT